MDKKRLRVALKVLEAVKTEYPETKNQRVSPEKHFCFAVSMLRDIVLS